MLSETISKHSITVSHSIYGAIFVLSLYCAVIFLLLLIFNISGLTFPLFIFLVIIAIYGVRKVYLQRYTLILSDSGRVEVFSSASEDIIRGIVSNSSFYNGLFLSLHLKKDINDFSNLNNNKINPIVIYRDAVSDSEYRLLARFINFGRD